MGDDPPPDAAGDDPEEGEGEADEPESEPEHPEDVIGGAADEAREQSAPAGDGPLADLDEDDLDRLLQQYVHYGEVAIETANLRVQMNRFFGLILTSILAGLFGLAQGGLSATSAAAVLFAAGFGIAVCYFWYQSLGSYRRLNKARYTILNQVESVLPVAMYLDEWRYLKRKKPDPVVIEPRDEADPDHKSHTIVELWFVRLLGTGYLTIGGYATGFIGTPIAAEFGANPPAPAITGMLVGGLVLAVAVVYLAVRYGR